MSGFNPSQNILIFDSGVGGLSVYQQIEQRLPQFNYIYLFDNQAYPYGELEPDNLIIRVNQLVSNMVAQHQIDLVVIACNTASTIVLPSLRQKLLIPVVGVVPAIKPASLIAHHALAVIATPATVKRSYTHDLIRNFANNKQVELLGSTRLVDMAEEKLRGKPVNLEELKQELLPLIGEVDVAVLGCTHFPLIKDEIQQVLGQEVTLIDSGEAIARRVYSLLIDNNDNYEYVEQRSEGVKDIYASTQPWQQCALDICLNKLGFNPIKIFPFQDALDR